MTFRIIFSPHAEQRLDDLFEMIEAQSGFDRASQFVGSIVAYCHGFNMFPERGSRRDDIRSGTRIVGFHRRVSIAFAVEEDSVIFLGIHYGGQDFEADLKDHDA